MGSDWRQIARDRIAIIKNNSDFRSQVISEKGGDIAYCDICCDIATRLIYIYIYKQYTSLYGNAVKCEHSDYMNMLFYGN